MDVYGLETRASVNGVKCFAGVEGSSEVWKAPRVQRKEGKGWMKEKWRPQANHSAISIGSSIV